MSIAVSHALIRVGGLATFVLCYLAVTRERAHPKAARAVLIIAGVIWTAFVAVSVFASGGIDGIIGGCATLLVIPLVAVLDKQR